MIFSAGKFLHAFILAEILSQSPGQLPDPLNLASRMQFSMERRFSFSNNPALYNLYTSSFILKRINLERFKSTASMCAFNP
jgi:hypothetical protein